jgi:hypothetical protein
VGESWGLGKLVGRHTTENYQNLKIREKSRHITKKKLWEIKKRGLRNLAGFPQRKIRGKLDIRIS